MRGVTPRLGMYSGESGRRCRYQREHSGVDRIDWVAATRGPGESHMRWVEPRRDGRKKVVAPFRKSELPATTGGFNVAV
jgi:hypothetical protein